MIYEYECKKCKEIQEKNVKMSEENKEPCEKCGAPASELKRIMSVTPKHGSWGRWTV